MPHCVSQVQLLALHRALGSSISTETTVAIAGVATRAMNKPHEQGKALKVSWLILKLLLTARMICTAGIVTTFCRRVVAFQKPLPPSFLHPSSDSSFNSDQQQDKEQIHELSGTALLEELKDGHATNS